MGECICKKCRSEARIDGDFPKYFAWCEQCSDYAKGFDSTAHAQEVHADMVDEADFRRKECLENLVNTND